MPALDLCLECKACKSECPTNVDMARLKAEFLHHYGQKHGLPVAQPPVRPCRRASALGLPPGTGVEQAGSQLAGALAGGEAPPDRWPTSATRVCTRTLRSTCESPICRRAEMPMHRNWSSFLDTFTNYHEPWIGMAATRSLAEAGYRMQIAGPPQVRCCGRPLISNGLLGEAVKHAKANVARLYPYAAEGKRIIACEPSCLLTIKDDYPALCAASCAARRGRGPSLPDV